MKYWVLLTGCKNNAGDFVIRNRVIHHLRSLRPDRDIIEFNSWEIIDQKKISIINSSEALILAGGPSLRRNIYPDVYPLLNDLNQISVPIIPLGIGWKHYDGSWPSLLNYKFTDASRKLIDKIKSSGCLASVRDYHPLALLRCAGVKKTIMTGCPVLFDRDNINELVNMNSNGKITVSLGVSFVDHERSESLHKYIINNIIKLFGRDRCQVVFHHTLSQNNFTKSYGQLSKLYFAQEKFSNWLRQEEINYVDISGGEKAFFNIYDESYLHVGFRVHAHLYMISQNKPSFLLAEDSRAIGMRHVLGGTIFDLLLDYRSEYNSQKFFGLKKTKKIRVDKIWSSGAVNQFINVLKSELDSPSLTLQQIRNKNNLYDDMKRFINELP